MPPAPRDTVRRGPLRTDHVPHDDRGRPDLWTTAAGGGLTAPRLVAPPGACDGHIHVFDHRFPLPPDPHFRPFEATVDDYRAVQRRLGLSRVVVVQSSAYGTDNRCMVDAVARLGRDARGVAMVGADVTDAELRHLAASGVAGLRFLMAAGGTVRWDEAERLAARAAALGMVVNLQVDGRTLPDRHDLLRRITATVVLDHVGMFKAPVGPDEPGFGVLLDLIAGGRTWVKISAPYAGGLVHPPYESVGVLTRALARAAPDRLVWGSNWPHPFSVLMRGGVAEDDAMLLDLLLDWVPDPVAVLASNSARLWSFTEPDGAAIPGDHSTARTPATA